MKKLGYNGRPEFSRPRKLTEDEYLRPLAGTLSDQLVEPENDRLKNVDRLYGRLAKTYLKGKALEEGLSQMGLAQFIPIEEGADSVSAAATRLDNEQSKKGTQVTFGLFQSCVKIVLAKKWELRLDYLNIQVPASREIEKKRTVEKRSNSRSGGGLLESFLSDNGIAATIIGMLTISPFQTIIFQGLTVESAAKGIQLAQIPAGIALFLELGIGADKIKDLLASTNVSTPVVEETIDRLDSSPEERAAALGDYGIDYSNFKRVQEVADAEAVIQYVTEYYTRFGGLVEPGSTLTIDHWIAYLHTAQNQQTIKSALYGASTFSPKFRSYEQPDAAEPTLGNGPITSNRGYSNISNELASALQSLNAVTVEAYNDIFQAFTYNLTDNDICCLVQIFGAADIDTEIIRTLADLMRIVAANASGGIANIASFLLSNLFNMAGDSVFDIVGQLNELYFKVIDKLTKAFTINIDNAPSCTALFSLGWSLIEAVNVLFGQLDSFVAELLSGFNFYGETGAGSWEASADRRNLLSLAAILEALSNQIDFINSCESISNVPAGAVPNDIVDPSEIVFDMIGTEPPTLNIPREKVEKYFPDLQRKQSKLLKFDYGIETLQNSESTQNNTQANVMASCSENLSSEALESMAYQLQSALKDVFNAS